MLPPADDFALVLMLLPLNLRLSTLILTSPACQEREALLSIDELSATRSRAVIEMVPPDPDDQDPDSSRLLPANVTVSDA